MTTITINERTKAGKTLLELAKILSSSNKGVIIDQELSKPNDVKQELTPKQKAWINRLKKSMTEAKEISEGKRKGQTLKSFLDEL